MRNVNTAYLPVGDPQSGLHVLDVSNSSSPARVGQLDRVYPEGLAVNLSYVLVADGNGGLTILQVSPSAPRVQGPLSVDVAGIRLVLRADSGQPVRLQRRIDLISWEDRQTVPGIVGAQPLVDESALAILFISILRLRHEAPLRNNKEPT